MRKHAIHFEGSGLTKQSFKDECDINKIMAKFQKTGAINHYAKYAPQYGVITQEDLQDALNVVADAETMFEELPAKLREKFQNDAGQFLEFVQNPNNLEEMRELGLAQPLTPGQTAEAKPTQSDQAPASTDPGSSKEGEGDGQAN